MRRFATHVRKILAVGILCAGSVLFACIIVIGSAVYVVYAHFQGNARLPADCAIVFGAAIQSSNQPGPAIIRRVQEAAALYKVREVQHLILSGGKGDQYHVSEAEAMRAQAIADGVDASALTLEDRSHSTWENLLYSRNLTSNCKSVIAISDAYHLARIQLLAGRQGWVDLMTYPASKHPEPGSEMRSVLREAVAYVYYALHIDEWISTQTLQKHIPFVGGQKISVAIGNRIIALASVFKLT